MGREETIVLYRGVPEPTVQQQILTGIIFIMLFAAGHCLPIMIAGCSTAAVRKLLKNNIWREAGSWFRRAAGIVIVLLGVYFILNPIIS